MQITTFRDALQAIRNSAVTERDKGDKFERLIKNWLLTDNRFSDVKKAWLWSDFPSRFSLSKTGQDVGIDLVALNGAGEYLAIQCKCYDECYSVNKEDVDSFLGTSAKRFIDPADGRSKVAFSHRYVISTTNRWSANAESAIEGHEPAVNRINLEDLESSNVNWAELLSGKTGATQAPKKLHDFQKKAIAAAKAHYAKNDRGRLIMACGTGKTFTSLKIADELLGGRGLVLFMVPSIALIGQAMNEWYANSGRGHIRAVCICSDAQASRIKLDDDCPSGSILDLPLGACTSPRAICEQLLSLRGHAENGLLVVFSTYQSIDALSRAQSELLRKTRNSFGRFDLAICDEAHRTTGQSFGDDNDSEFIKIHDEKYVRAARRLYMTATPRIYRENAKVKASDMGVDLYSMDNVEHYGEEFYRVTFSEAVALGCLTDYKVLVLTVSENDLTPAIREKVRSNQYESLDYETACKFVGTIAALSKSILGDKGETWQTDPRVVRRAMIFCNRIGNETDWESSKNVAAELPGICEDYRKVHSDESEHIVSIEAEHVDGSMGMLKRNAILDWLRRPADSPNTCKVVTNVRCLSEGVDVPSLDAVVFLKPRKSQVDIVQSVGRVMRNFRKGQEGEKKYGYIVVPVVVPAHADAKEWMDNNETFQTVWSVLNALRSHDERFNAYVNSIKLNNGGDNPLPPEGPVVVGGPGAGDAIDDPGGLPPMLPGLPFEDFEKGFYAKLVEKCGDRLYWERWAIRMGEIAKEISDRIATMLANGEHATEFEQFVDDLRKNINSGIDEKQAITMLAQHFVVRPIFEALFEEYDFVRNNSVSRSMQVMLEVLHSVGFDKDTRELEKFRQSVRDNMGKITTSEARQTVIKNLYESFFSRAFEDTVKQLGIVYTPVECVDFIIHSVEHLLNEQFGTSLTAPDVHILDPFTGTGTFIVRLLQSGLIRPEDMERKYLHEIHCNEIVLLAYYVADVNIENTFHSITGRTPYLPYDGICLTDTFNLNEHGDNNFLTKLFPENSAQLSLQRKAPVRIIIGNPPYSVAKDAVQYPHSDARLAETYVAGTKATLRNSLYDSYIRAFRWASDRIADNPEGGIVAFITNSGWIDSNAMDGMRACQQKEFSDVYVFNLRGAIRGRAGADAKKEGQNVFDIMTGVAITLLVNNPLRKNGAAAIHYHDIGNFLSRKEKLDIITNTHSIAGLEWTVIAPNDKHDWINQRDGVFDKLIAMGDKESRKSNEPHDFFCLSSNGLKTQRDAWMYNLSTKRLNSNIIKSISYYNENVKSHAIDDFRMFDGQSDVNFHWSRATCIQANKGKIMEYNSRYTCLAMYRPFFKQNLYFYRPLIDITSQISHLFIDSIPNVIICVSGVGVSKDFSCLITNHAPDFEFIGKSQCFPLYWYEEGSKYDLFQQDYVRRDGISDWILGEVRKRYGAKKITKEHIFYFVYGILHSKQYRERFAADLKKSLPRLPLPDTVDDFLAFERAGRKLADLHLHYESVPPCPGVVVQGAERGNFHVEKMKHPKKGQTDTIIYNAHIRITNIPARAYDYVVNGKSAIAWVMERYAIKTDKDSGITNDPNDWASEHAQPRYILDLLLSVINVSIQTMDIVDNLPKINGI